MTEDAIEQKPSAITEMSIPSLVRVLIAGLVVGAIAGALTYLLAMYIFKVMPCSADNCSSGGQYSAILAGVVSGMVALFWLIRLQVFRPLLVVIAVTIALWGVSLYVLTMPWYAVIIVSAGLHAAAYGLVAWVSRIRQFWIVIILLVLIIVGLRFMLINS
ncbi:MAG TPA: hypothetical protein VFT59_03710 [Candidatus Saccharimonadales bacterium]|nr:hypothetical protein [Candidatus Saccharimonadales bacterium]